MLLCRNATLVFLLSFGVNALAQEAPKSQPPLWSAKPDVKAFEKSQTGRLAAAQQSIDKLVAVKGARTIDNTLAVYDGTVRQINAAQYFASLMLQVHPEATFRDRATDMVRKASAVAWSLNREVYQALASLDLSQADAPSK